MLLRNSDIKEPVRINVMKALQPGSVRHCRRNRHHLFISLSHLDHDGRENIGIADLGRFLQKSGFNFKRSGSVESCGMMLRRKVSLSLVGNDMHHNGLADVLRLFNGCPHGVCVHSVDGSQIRDAQILEQHAGKEDGFDLVLGSADLLHNLRILVAQGIVHLVAKIQIRI